MSVSRLQEEIVQIIKEKFKINIDNVTDELLSNNVGLAPLDLAILFVVLEEKYHIKFSTQDILDHSFNNVQNIAGLINNKVT